jgi:xanthine dehydrogenase/oxidase
LAPEEVIVSIHIPVTRPNEYVRAYKQSRRRDDDIAIESACYRTLFEKNGEQWIVKEAVLSYGGMAKLTVRYCREE